MIFARYNGPKAENWTVGKVYFVMSGFDVGGVAVDVETIRLQDDAGKWQDVETAANLFVFPACVYAVCLKPVATLMKGEVVRVCNVSDEFLSVDKHGYLQASHFEILDLTNVTIGNKVKERGTGIWRKIARLDDDLFIGYEGAPEGTQESCLLSPDEFSFPVGNDGVLSEPMLKCIKEMEGELTDGKVYSPEQEVDGLIELVNDAGKRCSYMTERFTNDL